MRYFLRRPGGLLGAIVALAAVCGPLSVQAQVNGVRSPDGKGLAYTVARGRPEALMTEIWTARADGSGGRPIKAYLGEPGDLCFLPGGEGFVYLQMSLSYTVFGSHLWAEYKLPLMRNRVWRLKADGSSETLWPLPGELQPLRIAVSPDGGRLAVAGFRGSLWDREDRGLWVVDRSGDAVRLLNGRVTGPLRWSSERIFCAVEEEGGLRGVAVQVETGEVADADAPEAEAYAGGDAPADVADVTAPGLISNALDRYMRGYHAMHQNRPYRLIKNAYGGAIRAFEQLYKGSGISKADCLGYIQALRARMPRKKSEGERWHRRVCCREHQLVVGTLFEGYAQAHGQLPPTLEDLRFWMERQLEERASREEAPEEAVERDRTTLAHIFRCATDPDRERSISYVYRPGAPPGTPVLLCYWHRGELLRLRERSGGYRAEVLTFYPDQVDSLNAAAAGYLEAGAADSAVALLEVVSHQRHKDPVSHNTYGYAALEAKDHGLAEKAFKRAASLSKGKVLARAYYGLGLIHMERSRGRQTAIEYFRDALSRDREFVDARYQMARARVLLWQYDARSDIKKVLKMDPNYADAYLLMGDYEADLNKDYERAIPWYTKYLALRPDDPVGRNRLSMAYLQVKDYDKVMETLLGFVQEHPDAIELLPIVSQACAKQDKLDLAMGFFKAYVSKLDPEELAFYRDISRFASKEELAEYSRASGAEQEAFLKRFWNGRDPDLSTPVNERLLEHYRRVWYSRQSFSKERQPWDMRGEVYVRFGEPDHRTSSAMMNARQSLEVQRVKERMALDLYGSDGNAATYVGPVYPVRTLAMGGRLRDLQGEFEASEIEVVSEEFDDQQMDMVVAGPNTRTDSESGMLQRGEGGNQQSQSQGQSQSQSQSRSQTPVTAAISDASDGSFSGDLMEINEMLGLEGTFSVAGEDFLKFGEYRPVITSGADVSTVPWESWVYTRIGGGIEITFTDESGKGAYNYAPVPMAFGVSARQMTKFARYAPETIFQRAVAAFPDFYTPEYDRAPFDFYFDLADFRGENGKSVIEVYYGMPGVAARYVPEEGVTRLVVKRQAALVGTALDTVYRTSGDLFYQVPGSGVGAFVPDIARLEVPPGTYRLEVRARDRMTGRIGLYRKEVEVEDYGEEGLQLSDLTLAWRIAQDQPVDKFTRNGLNVIPMPTRMYSRGQGIFVYYEIYNLVRDAFGQTKYRVEYTIRPAGGNIVSRLVRTIVGKKKEVVVGYEQVGDEEMETVHMELDLGETTPGRHYLKVTVTDLNSEDGERVVKDVPFMVGQGGG